MLVEVHSTTPDLLINTFIQGLKPDNIYKSSLKKSSDSFEGLLAKVEKCINIEEAQTARVEELTRVPRIQHESRSNNSATQTTQDNPMELFTFFHVYPVKSQQVQGP